MSDTEAIEDDKIKDSIYSTNIFDDFSQDEKLKDEVEQSKKEQEKGRYYYLSIIARVLGIINLFFFLFYVGGVIYIYIQNSDEMDNISALNPICGAFIWEGTHDWGDCSGVSSLLSEYERKQWNIENKVYKQIIDSISDVHYLSNFSSSKEALFLVDKEVNRMQPLKVLEEFDTLKNEFEPALKWRIQCKNIRISWNSIIEIECDAYSTDWNTRILWPSWKKDAVDLVKGTSMSVASSFINFLEKQSKTFTVLEKTKMFWISNFSSSDVVYSKKTKFELKLQLNTNTIWTLK